MAAKSKTFDCVEMKRKAQEVLLGEFASRRAEFTTLTDFLNAKVAESDWASAIWAKLPGPPANDH